MEQQITSFVEKYAFSGWYFPEVRITDIVEVLILTFLFYHIMVWIRNTKAWMLLKGIIVLAGFILIAAIFKMHTILYIAKNSVTVMATTAIVVFQKGKGERGSGKKSRAGSRKTNATDRRGRTDC